MNVLKKHNYMHEKLLVFNEINANLETLLKIGHTFFLLMYGLDGTGDINENRHRLYNKGIARQTLAKSFNLVVLPPTRDALNQHILRTYLQGQFWLVGFSCTRRFWMENVQQPDVSRDNAAISGTAGAFKPSVLQM